MGASQSQSSSHARNLLPKIEKDAQICVLEEKDMDEIVELCVTSFVGNATTPGEQTFRWTFGPENREDPPDSCERFKAGLKYYMYWSARASMWYGSCIGWRDEKSGKLLGCALCFHPGSINQPGKPIGTWRFINMIMNVKAPPPDQKDEKTYGPWAKLRNQQMGEAQHELHRLVPGRHWYVYVLAAHPEHKGKGVGTQLLQAVKEMARLDEEPLTAVYLECADAMRAYYEKQQMKSIKTKELADPNPAGEGKMTAHAMMCVPSLLTEKAQAEGSNPKLYPKV
eukprot:CAMPEP_0196724218 /NCGR_PEP_ID=MMETSP1091-20130531/6167_1 /TAXON_ID=302021 /ORGANISM="Rhodomonas sp., Strain CCMP768" /LENGTH=281 /DNA_ID=CAMNT_0042066319 /DNA_START=38 /DNA_END=883 /DNA_ORIENTATION=+